MADANVPLNPWHPMTDPVDIKHIGKLIEELGELQAALARCLIQGIDEQEPVSGVINRGWLENEVADVEAGLFLLKYRFGLDQEYMTNRSQKKTARLQEWHRMA
jgi:hypothetical protein